MIFVSHYKDYEIYFHFNSYITNLVTRVRYALEKIDRQIRRTQHLGDGAQIVKRLKPPFHIYDVPKTTKETEV